MMFRTITMLSNMTVETEAVETTSPLDILDILSNVSGLLQDLWWLLLLVITIIVSIYAIFNFGHRSQNYSKSKLNELTQNGKYIPNLFVELNDSKEVIRYFIYGKKWRKRLLKKYTFIYSNHYGDILKNAVRDENDAWMIASNATTNQIHEKVVRQINLHNALSHREYQFKPDYKESQYIFEIVHMPYEELLIELEKESHASCCNYMVLTGSAGNGKTNLLCSITELLIKLKQSVIFLNACEISEDPNNYVMSELKIPEFWKKHNDLYWKTINTLLKVRGKQCFIIIDAVNENDRTEFCDQISLFIREIISYSQFKVIVSCRNEYYDERYREYLICNIGNDAIELDLKEGSYSEAALKRMLQAYSQYFHFTGTISPSVENILFQQLLLLRIFFEVNTNSSKDILTIKKHDIFMSYISKIQKTTGENIEKLLDKLSSIMIEYKCYDGLSISLLESKGIDLSLINTTVDESILISKKMVSHAGTLAENQKEIIYFVFDELRDYILARHIVLSNINNDDSVNTDRILDIVTELYHEGSSAAEGVLHYIYVFFRTDPMIMKNGNASKICSSILNLYRNNNNSRHHYRHRIEFKNLGLRILFTMGLPLAENEEDFVRNCLVDNPRDDGGIVFDYMLKETLLGGVYNLNDYLSIILGIRDKRSMQSVLGEIVGSSYTENYCMPDQLIDRHKQFEEENPDVAEQIQKVAEIFLLCIQLTDEERQEKLESYFYHLETHESVKRNLAMQVLEIWNGEGASNE